MSYKRVNGYTKIKIDLNWRDDRLFVFVYKLPTTNFASKGIPHISPHLYSFQTIERTQLLRNCEVSCGKFAHFSPLLCH